jgi:hypothetical protein
MASTGEHRVLAAKCLVLAAFLLAAQSGCSYPRPVRTYEYVADYDRMVDTYEPLLSLVYMPQPPALARYPGIIIGPVEVGGEGVRSRADAIGYATYFRIVLRNELAKLREFQFVELQLADRKTSRPFQGALLLQGKITRFDAGSGLMRYLSYFLFFLEGGATDFQLEGRITEADTGRLLVEFVDRRRDLCNTAFGPNPSNFSKGFAMNVTARKTAECLAKFVSMAHEGLQATVARAADTAQHASGL